MGKDDSCQAKKQDEDLPKKSPSESTKDTSEGDEDMKERIDTAEGSYSHRVNDDVDWKKVARELERYNFLAAQRIELAKRTIKWVIILIIVISLFIFAYKIYEMHFYTVSELEILPLETDLQVMP